MAMNIQKLSEIAYIYKKKFAHGDASEEITKKAIIEPVLSLLGWNINDTDEVRPEWRNTVDYALFIDRQIVYIEAKKAEHMLTSASEQVKSYAAAHGESVEFVVVTNGRNWRCYSVRNDLEVFSHDITKEPHKERNLSLLNKESVKNGDLTNAANFVRAEHEVIEYLRFKKDSLINDLCKSDSSLSLPDVKKVFEQLLIKEGELAIPKTFVLDNRYPNKSSRTVSTGRNRISGGRKLNQLPVQYLKSVAEFIERLELETGKKVESIHVGKTGLPWHPEANVRPNFYVVCNDGSEYNKKGEPKGYDPAHCVTFSREQFFSILSKMGRKN